MMAEALLANGLVSAIERVTYQCVKVQKSDDEVAKAVIEVVGDFGVCTQWTAVYRVLVPDIALTIFNTVLLNVTLEERWFFVCFK